MKKLYFLIFLVGFYVQTPAQWNLFCVLPSNPPMYSTGSSGDAEFINPSTGISLQDYFFSPSSGGGFTCAYTNDGAVNWTGVFGNSGLGISSIGVSTVKKQNTFYIIHNDQGSTRLEKFDNSGQTWTNYGAIGAFLCNFFSCDTNVFYATYYYNSHSYLTKYNHGILNYNYAAFASVTITGLFFPDTTNGYVIGTNSSLNTSHLILKTFDGGVNWLTVLDDSLININKIYFPNVDLGYIIGNNGNILRTNDGGSSWQSLNSGVTTNLNSIYFLNDSLGFVCGDSGVILRTSNFGNTWSLDSTNTQNNFSKIFFVNDSIGFALSIVEGKIYYINILNSNNISIDSIPIKYSSLVYPNPSKGECNINISNKFPNFGSVTFCLYDNTSRLVQKNSLQVTDGIIRFNFATLDKGLYFYTINDNEFNLSGKIVFE